MSEYVTVSMTLPKRLYRRARDFAREHRRSTDDLVADALELILPPGPQEAVEPAEDTEAAVQREMEAFVSLHPTLKAQYLGRYVAVLDGRLIDHDADQAALYRRISARYPGRFVWLSPVEEEPLATFHVRSPRIDPLS